MRWTQLAGSALSLSVAGTMLAQAPHLSEADREHLLNDKFEILQHAADVPPAVKKAFAQRVKEPTFRMADPGQPFQVGDAVMEPGLPFRRLVFAGLSREYCFLHYEKGGIAHVWYVVLFRLAGKGEENLVWGALCDWGGFDSLAKMREGLRKGKLKENAHDFW